MAKKRLNLRNFLERDKVDLARHTSWISDSWWYVQTLIDACKDSSAQEYEIELDSIDLAISPWGNISVRGFIQEIIAMEKIDFEHPIIVSPGGWIMDGWHRVAKAILDGKQTLRAIRLNSLPEPDGKKT